MKTLSEKQLLKRIKSKYDYHHGALHFKDGERRAGKKVGTRSGIYMTTTVDGALYYVHRLTFLYCNGYLPKMLDHINNDRHDNRIENLREANRNQNSHNRVINKNNTSGVKGVTFHKKTGKWMARVRYNLDIIYCGIYSELKDAEIAVKKKREQLHGKYANHG